MRRVPSLFASPAAKSSEYSTIRTSTCHSPSSREISSCEHRATAATQSAGAERWLAHARRGRSPRALSRFLQLDPGERGRRILSVGGGETLITFKVETEQEDDGRWLAEVVELPGVLAYGDTQQAALSKVQALALRVIAERLEHGEAAPELLSISFNAARITVGNPARKSSIVSPSVR